MQVSDLSLEGLKLIDLQIFKDPRGLFFENYNRERYAEVGIECEFVQDNCSYSNGGVLRGLHYQSNPGQAKLISVIRGKIFDVAVDIRPESASFGLWEGIYMSSENRSQLFMPVGFAHGFCVISMDAEVLYKTSAPYDPEYEHSLRWDDPDIGIHWPITEPYLSKRDQEAESFAAYKSRQ